MAARRGRIAGGKRRNGSRAVAHRRREADAGDGAHATQSGVSSHDANGDAVKDSEIATVADNEWFSGVTLLHQAMAVAAAADAYSARGRTNISALALQFLLGRSLELALSAYLTYKDCAEGKPREIGQDLSMLLEQATVHSFEFRGGTSDADRRAVAALSPNYMRKMFGRPLVAGRQLVTSRMLREIVHRAITAVFLAIWNEDPVRFNLRRASDRALGLCIADDACYEGSAEAAGDGTAVAAVP
jgi:hypothetical protein